MSEYAPYVIVRNLKEFLEYRGLELMAKELRAGVAPVEAKELSRDDVISQMEQKHYVRIDARRRVPRGKRDRVIILVLEPGGQYAVNTPHLRNLLAGVKSEQLAKEDRLDELIIIADDGFFTKNNMIALFQKLRKEEQPERGGNTLRDYLNGEAPVYNLYPYIIFAVVIPQHIEVPPHTILDEKEVELFHRQTRKNPSDLKLIYTTDAPVAWLGARPGQVVEIIAPSETAGKARRLRLVVQR